MSEQGTLNFDAPGDGGGALGAGHARWLFDRLRAKKALARKLNLPLGHDVEVWLHGGIRLRGELCLKEELLFVENDRVNELELLIGKATFLAHDIESCVRMD